MGDSKKKFLPKIRCRQWHYHETMIEAQTCDVNHWVELLVAEDLSLTEAHRQVRAYYEHKRDEPKPAVAQQERLFE